MELSPSAGIQHLKRAILRRRLLTPSRRYFVLGTLGAAVAAVSGFVAYHPKTWVTVGAVEAIPSASFSAFEQGEQSVFLRKTSDGDVEALSQRCTHLGCRVSWNAAENEFRCPCHRGVFDRTGTPISGPPKRPLDRFETRIEGGTVQVFL